MRAMASSCCPNEFVASGCGGQLTVVDSHEVSSCETPKRREQLGDDRNGLLGGEIRTDTTCSESHAVRGQTTKLGVELNSRPLSVIGISQRDDIG